MLKLYLTTYFGLGAEQNFVISVLEKFQIFPKILLMFKTKRTFSKIIGSSQINFRWCRT
jgi:hypothetical protein